MATAKRPTKIGNKITSRLTAGNKGHQMQAAKRNERSAAAHERNSASKQVKEDYRSAVKSGDSERVKGKKPWWKIWGSDSE